MTQIKDILSIRLEDDISSVIDLNAQSESDVKEELDSFILTESLAKHLSDFCDTFESGAKQSGVWISGFYGSGKSYFAKMLGLLLSNRMIMGTSMQERFAPKLDGLRNSSVLKNSIDGLAKTRNHVVQFDSAKHTGNAGINYMIFGNFLKSLGFLDNWIGLLEYNMMLGNDLSAFKAKVKEQTGAEWDEIKKNLVKSTKTFKDAFLALGYEQDIYNSNKKMAEDRIANYDASKLKEDIERYLRVNPDLRIVFMIDEVSEAIAQKKINILDLEGMAEALSSLGQKVWTVAIAQLQLDDVINSQNLDQNKVTKIIDRFRCRISIDAEEVTTIIRRRLLAKTDEGVNSLSNFFNKNSGQIKDITNFGGTGLKTTQDAASYADYYPFFESQIKMLQYFLFGTSKVVKTQVGTRGMVISVFDVLKKEAMKDENLYTHVNGHQLCNQAEDKVPEVLRHRYEQAESCLKDNNFTKVSGKKLLLVIHFLTGAEVINTSAENITKSYISKIEDYYPVLEEIKKALELLVEKNILIYTGNQYRITSEIEQRIISVMTGFEPQNFRITGETTKHLKNQKIIKDAQSTLVDGTPCQFHLEMNNGEPLNNVASKAMKIIFYDPFINPSEVAKTVEDIKTTTQYAKDTITLVPAVKYSSDIYRLAKEILQINYVISLAWPTQEEKDVVRNIESGLDTKEKQLDEAIRKAYNEGVAVYLYNSYQLTDDNVVSEIDKLEKKAYDNVFSRRLTAQLKDDLAAKTLKVADNQLQHLYGTSDEFKFFDSTGNFIGDKLSVVTEILDLAKSHISGKDLEKQLTGAPTGFAFGTIITTVAALFRGSKVIAKYNGKDYFSYRDSGADTIFSPSSHFANASFKAISKSLTYSQKQEIVDTLKEDCNYKKWTGEQINYTMNDFQLVDALRTLSKELIRQISSNIEGDYEREKLFKYSIQAKDIFKDFAGTVTELNYYDTATRFLDGDTSNKYVDAVDRVEKDLNFIENNLKVIIKAAEYIENVEAELNQVGADKREFGALRDEFKDLRDKDLVKNFAALKQKKQEIRDLYFKMMNEKAKKLNAEFTAIETRAIALRDKIDTFPAEWNETLRQKVSSLISTFKRYKISEISLDEYSVRCTLTGFMLRDLESALKSIPSEKTNLQVLESEIVTTAPQPKPEPPQNKPKHGGDTTPPAPATQKERKVKSILPKGKKSVADYKEWLADQLLFVNKCDETDILNFDE